MIDRAQLITMQVQDGLELFPKPLGHHHILGSHPLEQQVVTGNHQHHPHHHSSLTMVTGQTRLDEHSHSQHAYNAHLHQQSNRIDEEDEDCDDTEEEEDGESDEEEERMVKNQQQQQQSNPWQSDFNGRQEYNSTSAPTYEHFEAAHFGGNDFGHKMNTESAEYSTYAGPNNNGGQASNAQGDRESNSREKNVDGSIASPDGVTYYSQFPTPESSSETGMIASSSTVTSSSSNESLLQLVPVGGGTTTMASTSAVGVTPSGGLVESETYFAERRRTYSFLSPNHTNSNSNSSTSSTSSTSTNEPTSFGTLATYNGTGNDSTGTTAAATSNRNYVMMQSSIINQSNHYHHHYHHYHYYCPNMHQPYHHHHPLLAAPAPHPSLHGAYSASQPPSSTSPTLSSGSSSSMGASTSAPCSVAQLAPPALPPPSVGGALVPLHLQTPTAYPALPWHTNTNHHLQSGQSTSNAYHNGNGYLHGHHHSGQQGPFDDDQSMTSASNLSYPESPKCKYIAPSTF